MKPYKTQNKKNIKQTITVAPDKSISHRSLIFAALAKGESKIRNLLLGEDVLRTLTILNDLGIQTSHSADDLKGLIVSPEITVYGKGLKGFQPTTKVLYCGNSGTTMRLMIGLLTGLGFAARLTGDASLNKRPMARITKPLESMGGKFSEEYDQEDKNVRYIRIHASEGLKDFEYDSPVASAQVKTALLLAGLVSGKTVRIYEPSVSRNHTELMLSSMGAKLKIEGFSVTIHNTKSLKPLDIDVPGDISSAAFFMVAGLIVPNSEITIQNVNLNPTRTGIFDALKNMNGDIRILNPREQGGEPCSDLVVTTSELKNIEVFGDVIPRLIDEIPILALAAARASGRFLLRDAKELRVKETDRIKAICDEFLKLGIRVEEEEDGFVIDGPQDVSPVQITGFQTYHDHRIAMTLSIAGLISDKSFEIDDVSCVETSFPSFYNILSKF